MREFKVGDKVNVRKDLKDHGVYGNIGFVEPMEESLGKTITISKVIQKGAYTYYRIKEDFEQWNWTEEMFEGEIQQTIE